MTNPGAAAVAHQDATIIGSCIQDFVYGAYTASERASGRQRYHRNLSSTEWRRMHGDNFHYSSDYIHANPKAFGAVVGNMARLANRTEELGECFWRFAGGWSRLLGALYLGCLREMVAYPRFERQMARRLHRHLQKNQPESSASKHLLQLKALMPDENAWMQVIQAWLPHGSVAPLAPVTIRGTVTKSICDSEVINRFVDATIASLEARASAQKVKIDSAALKAALGEPVRKMLLASSLVKQPPHMTYATRIAMTLGCLTATGVATAVYIALGTAVGVAELSWIAKTNALACVFYLSAFTLRSATVLAARTFRSHNGYTYVPRGVRNYTGLFELAGAYLYKVRDTAYTFVARKLLRKTDWTYQHMQTAKGDSLLLSELQRSRAQAVVLAQDPTMPVAVRGLMKTAVFLHRVADVTFHFERELGQVCVANPLKQHVFRYHSDLTHQPLWDAQGKCNILTTYKAAERTRLGRFRQGLASFIGHGGADCLGMAFGTGVVSAAMTAANMAMAGGMFFIARSAEIVAPIPLGIASVCAGLWGASVAVETGGRIVHKAFGVEDGAQTQPAVSIVQSGTRPTR